MAHPATPPAATTTPIQKSERRGETERGERTAAAKSVSDRRMRITTTILAESGGKP
jgi:hypothetical protein